VAAHKGDVSTGKGRSDIRSLAAEIRSSKANLVRLGKSLTEGWRDQTKAVNAECKVIEERLDDLAERVRAPLTAFENMEKERVADHERALAAIPDTSVDHASATAEELSNRLDYLRDYPTRDWQEFAQRAADAIAAEIARTEKSLTARVASDEEAVRQEAMRIELERLRAAEVEREKLAAEERRIAREEQLQREAAERARIEAEAEAQKALQAERDRAARELREAAEAAKAERDAAERRDREASEALAAAERRRQEDAAKAERDRIAAEQKAQAERDAAVADERQRAIAQAKAERDEAARREANVAHRRKINRDAMAPLLLIGLTEEQAQAVIVAIAKGEVPHVRIEY